MTKLNPLSIWRCPTDGDGGDDNEVDDGDKNGIRVGVALTILHSLFYTSQQFCELCIIIFPIVQLRKPRLKGIQ